MILGSADGTNNGWSLQNDLFTPINASYVPNYVAGIMADLTLKRNAGFPVSFGLVSVPYYPELACLVILASKPPLTNFSIFQFFAYFQQRLLDQNFS